MIKGYTERPPLILQVRRLLHLCLPGSTSIGMLVTAGQKHDPNYSLQIGHFQFCFIFFLEFHATLNQLDVKATCEGDK